MFILYHVNSFRTSPSPSVYEASASIISGAMLKQQEDLSVLCPPVCLPPGDLWQNWTSGRDVFDKLLLDADWAVNNGNVAKSNGRVTSWREAEWQAERAHQELAAAFSASCVSVMFCQGNWLWLAGGRRYEGMCQHVDQWEDYFSWFQLLVWTCWW